MSLKTIFLCILMSILSINAFAQHDVETGAFGGFNKTGIPNAEKIIISEPYFLSGQGINYTFNNKSINQFRAGAFINYKFVDGDGKDNATWYIYGEAAYSGEGTQLRFDDLNRDYHYAITFKYQYANILAFIGGKLYGANLSIGPELGFNVAPRHIDFKSWGKGKLDAFETDPAQQQQFRNVLYGKSNFGLIGAIGYQIFTFADIEFRYHLGFKNIIEVEPNTYNWLNQTNHNNNVQLVLKFYLTHRDPVWQ